MNIVLLPGISAQTLSLSGGTSVQSEPFPVGVEAVKVWATVPFRIEIGENPTATGNSAAFPGNAGPYSFFVPPGNGSRQRVSIVTVDPTATGKVHIDAISLREIE